MRSLALLAWLCCSFLASYTHAKETSPIFIKPLLADLSTRHIDVHSSFTGMEILLYGARNVPGDVLVTLTGPYAKATLRKKEKIAGMWMNTEQVRITNAPVFYRMASTAPIDTLLTAQDIQALGIGYDHMLTRHVPQAHHETKQALHSLLRNKNWVSDSVESIRFFSGDLFKATFFLPDNLPRGHYHIDVYLIENRKIKALQTIPLVTVKSGIDAWLFDTAQKHDWLYGLASILLALGSGFLAHRLFRR